MIQGSPPPSVNPEALLAEQLERFASGDLEPAGVLPWAAQLPGARLKRLRNDLQVVLAEPHTCGEPLDWCEVQTILRDYAAMAGWGRELVRSPEAELPPHTPYSVRLRSADLRRVETASAAVRDVCGYVLQRFLPFHPTAADQLERGKLKKLGDRELWQIDLPDGYRLRYLCDKPERVVHVTYLGPHPDGAADGREHVIRASIRQRRATQD